MSDVKACVGFQRITSLSSATALTVPAGASMALISCETQAVRFRSDRTDPTASIGFPLAVGTVLTYTGPLAAVKFIEQAASASLNVEYYGDL